MPIRRVSRWVPPPPGMIPRRTSGWPMKKSPSAMTRRSHAQANSAPRPRAEPLRAATKMTPLAFIRRNVVCRRSSWTAPPHRGPAHHGPEDAGAVHALGRAYDGGGTASADRGTAAPSSCSHRTVGMADEPLGMRPGEDDGMDVRVAVGPVHQLVQLVGDVEAEQLCGPPSTRTIRTAPRSSTSRWPLSLYGMDSAPVLSSWVEVCGDRPWMRVAAMGSGLPRRARRQLTGA